MYHNVGKKIKTLAKILALLGTILCILGGIGIIVYGLITGHAAIYNLGIGESVSYILISIISGLALALFGSLFVFIDTLLLYGFGEIIDKVTDIEINTRNR